VAEMAGLPEDCIDRARTILKQLESGDHRLANVPPEKTAAQLELFGEHPLVEELKSLHVESMTPLEALNKLHQMKDKLNG
jgi:DNA mismatch repair protein MutS